MDPLPKKPLGPQPLPDPVTHEEKKTRHVPKSTLIIFWLFVIYFVITIIAAVYYMTITRVKIFNLNNLASLSSNLTSTESLDLPICVSRTNKSALRSSVLENVYGGRVKSFDLGLASKSADLNSMITIEKGFNNFFSYYINNDEIRKVTFYNGSDTKYRTLEGLEVGDSVVITETINLRRPPNQSKTKIEIEVI